MKAYYYTPETSDLAISKGYTIIRGVLERAGISVISKHESLEQALPENYKQVEQQGRSPLEYVDAIIIEGTDADSEVGYLLAYAIAQKKQALLLLRKGKRSRNPLTSFGRQSLKNLKVVYYDDTNAERLVITFLRTLGDISVKEAPTIKFTLRITPVIERFLHWKTHNTQMTKADYLRNMIEEAIEEDEEFQKYRRRSTEE